MFFEKTAANPIIIETIKQADLSEWLQTQSAYTRLWLSAVQFQAEPGECVYLPNKEGTIERVIAGDDDGFWFSAKLADSLKPGTYQFSQVRTAEQYLAWGLAQYQFTRYKSCEVKPRVLIVGDALDELQKDLNAINLTRDLINTPAQDMGPADIAKIAEQMAKQFKADFRQWVGEELLTDNFPAIHTVGAASHRSPRLVMLTWGNPAHRKLSLVGKGVCFDTGGLDLKPSRFMRLMKKDMGGSAHVLGLAHMIMAHQLPVYLQVLIPAVDNAVSANAYRPGDVIMMRCGKTVEVGNTDAEGRLVVGDALSYACEFEPELIIDMCTLTGAARVALGTDIPVLFSNQDKLTQSIQQHASAQHEHIWPLPLHQPYLELIKSPIADLDNSGEGGYAGAITAALFLEQMLTKNIPWMHLDLMAWNTRAQPGRPKGGEAMGLRALLSFCRDFAAGA